MEPTEKKDSKEDYRLNLSELQKRRNECEAKKRKDERGYSLKALRFSSLLNQLQALQALQGLQEMIPTIKGDIKKRRFVISEDQKERSSHRQWLIFKTDWLEALLEDTIEELEALDDYESQKEMKTNTPHPSSQESK